jgi:flagellar motor switch protein FliG
VTPAALAPVPSRALSGRQKAAILCLTLGAEQAAKLTQELTAEEADLISLEMARMGRVDPDAAETVLSEWVEMTIASDAVSAGGVEYARSVLEKALGPQKADTILRRVTRQLQNAGGIERLQQADPRQVANLFRAEHPQTVALVLAHMSKEHAAAVLKELGPDISAEVAFRMARMQKVSPDMVGIIERTLGSNPDFDFQHGVAAAGGPSSVAALLNLLQGPIEQSILDRLAEQDPTLSEEIRNLMFVFEDLRNVDDRALQRLLRDVDTKQLAIALKGASPELKQRIVSQMSQRAAASLNDEIDLLGPTRVKDVEAAQTGIVAQARALEAAGEVVLLGGKDDALL